MASPTSHHPTPLSSQLRHPVLGKPLCLPPSTCPRCDYASPGASQGPAPQRQPSLLSRQGTLSVGGDQGVSALGLQGWPGSQSFPASPLATCTPSPTQSPQEGEQDRGAGTWVQEHASPSTSATLTASSYLEQVALAGVGDFLLPFPVQPGKTAKK